MSLRHKLAALVLAAATIPALIGQNTPPSPQTPSTPPPRAHPPSAHRPSLKPSKLPAPRPTRFGSTGRATSTTAPATATTAKPRTANTSPSPTPRKPEPTAPATRPASSSRPSTPKAFSFRCSPHDRLGLEDPLGCHSRRESAFGPVQPHLDGNSYSQPTSTHYSISPTAIKLVISTGAQRSGETPVFGSARTLHLRRNTSKLPFLQALSSFQLAPAHAYTGVMMPPTGSEVGSHPGRLSPMASATVSTYFSPAPVLNSTTRSPVLISPLASSLS